MAKRFYQVTDTLSRNVTCNSQLEPRSDKMSEFHQAIVCDRASFCVSNSRWGSPSLHTSLIVLVGMAIMFAASSVHASLIGHWTFDNTATDSAGSQDGTLTNGASYSTTEVRVGSHSIELDGDDDYVELGTVGLGNPLMLNNSPHSITAWVYQNANDIFPRVIDKSNGGGGANGYDLWVDSSGVNGHGYNVDGNPGNFDSEPANLGAWEQITITNAGAGANNLKIYTDGVETASVASPALPPNVVTNMRIGTWNHTDGREWDGFLDDIGVWNDVLTPAEVMAVYSLSADGDPLGNGADLDYNLSSAEDLFDLHDTMGSGLLIDGLVWSYTTGLSSDLGELTKVGEEYFLRLDVTGTGLTGVAPVVPEPSSILLLGFGAFGLIRHVRRRKHQPLQRDWNHHTLVSSIKCCPKSH